MFAMLPKDKMLAARVMRLKSGGRMIHFAVRCGDLLPERANKVLLTLESTTSDGVVVDRECFTIDEKVASQGDTETVMQIHEALQKSFDKARDVCEKVGLGECAPETLVRTDVQSSDPATVSEKLQTLGIGSMHGAIDVKTGAVEEVARYNRDGTREGSLPEGKHGPPA